MRPAQLGAIGWLLLVPALYLSAFDLLTPRKLREVWRGPNALAGELDETLACDLVTDYVKANEYKPRVSCDGALVSLGDVARLQVVVDKQVRSYCLARAPYWVVLRSTQQLPCFPSVPPDLSRPIESEQERVQATEQADLNEWVDGIRLAMASTERPTRCPQIKRARHGVEVPLLEYELLQSSGDPNWAFLTTPWLHDALVRGDAAAVAKAHRRWSEDRPWVAVVTSASREPPRVLPHLQGLPFGNSWQRGQLTGTLSLIDAGSGALLCERDFSFRSSDRLDTDPPPSLNKRRFNIAPLFDKVTDARVQADFKFRYDSAALRTIHEMTAYGVRTTLY